MEGGPGAHAPPPHTHTHTLTHTHFNFRTKQNSKISASNIKDIVFHGCLEIMTTRNFIILLCMLQFRIICGGFHFSNYTAEIDHFMLELLKRSDT